MGNRISIMPEPISSDYYLITQIVPRSGVTPRGIMDGERFSGVLDNAKEFHDAY